MDKENLINKVVEQIIIEQGHVIGLGLSVSRAKYTGLIDLNNSDVESLKIKGDPKETLEQLVHSYGEIFGQASVDVCINVLQTYPYNEIEPYLAQELKSKLSK